MKVKGNEHQSSKTKTLAPIDVELIKNIKEFAENVATESRFNQAIDYLKQNKIPLERKSLGDFLKWVNQDVLKEESDTIIKNNLEPKLVNGEVCKIAKAWFFANEDKF